jgi:hypothetical protein
VVTAVIIVVILSLAIIQSIQDERVISRTGTVTFVALEFGFWGIIGDDGKHYDPVNLDEEFQVDGLRVQFKARISENQVSSHMWGTIVEIIEIHKL